VESITGRRATDPPRENRAWRSPKTRVAWAISGVCAAVVGATLLYATLVQVRALTRPVPPTPPEVSRDILVRNAGDEAGRTATFRILLFTDEFKWRMSSHDRLEQIASQPHFSDAMRAVLDDAREIICVGASSEEMARSVPLPRAQRLEERRAGLRAEQIAVWVRSAVTRPIPIRKLNAGYHAQTGDHGDTSDQRRVVIILVLEHEKDTNIDQALRSAMARESVRAPIFQTLLTKYSLAAGTAFTWVD
jgi:hypothetical protein